jgi:hypothetical protein
VLRDKLRFTNFTPLTCFSSEHPNVNNVFSVVSAGASYRKHSSRYSKARLQKRVAKKIAKKMVIFLGDLTPAVKVTNKLSS